MRAVAQRVRRAEVRIDGRPVGTIGAGLLVLAAAEEGDEPADADRLVKKIVNLRIFADPDDKMNLSVRDVGGSLLLVSQFTLMGDCRKGNRPAFVRAMAPDRARGFFESFVRKMRETGVPVETGVFAAMMDVELVNDGPVTVILDTRREI